MDDFAEQIRELAAKIEIKKPNVHNEETTKTAMVQPFLQVLGYDVSDPTEVIPEFNDVRGVKKGEKVDYAIVFNNEPTILIEVKSAQSALPPLDMEQLLRYFFGNTESKFAILTNGIEYQFFSDLNEKNRMDTIPFLTINLVPSIREPQINELKNFKKDSFNTEIISEAAIDLKNEGELKRYFKKQFIKPDDDFIKFLIIKVLKPSTKIMATKPNVEKYSKLVKKAYNQYISDIVADITTRASDEAKRDEAKKIETGTIKENLSETGILTERFWDQLLSYAKTKTDLHSKVSPGHGSGCGTGAGTSGLGYNYVIFQHQTRVELYIDKGEQAVNKEIFDRLFTAKEGIEQTFRETLEWERLEKKRASRIKKDITLGGYRDDEQNWPKIYEATVDAMIRLHAALSPHIQYLKR